MDSLKVSKADESIMWTAALHLAQKTKDALQDVVQKALGNALYKESRWHSTIAARFVTLPNDEYYKTLLFVFYPNSPLPSCKHRNTAFPEEEFDHACKDKGWHAIIVEFVAVFSGITQKDVFNYAAISAAVAFEPESKKKKSIYPPKVISFTNLKDFKEQLLATPLAQKKTITIKQIGDIEDFPLKPIFPKESASVEDDKGFLTLKI